MLNVTVPSTLITAQGTLDVSVVTRAYTEKRWDTLVQAVASVRQQPMQPREIILVIDHNPALLERARTTFPDAVVVENQQTLGSGGTLNTGMLTAQSAIVAFLDDDAQATPSWLEQLCSPYADPDVVGVGGIIQPAWQAGRPGWFPSEFDWVVGCTYRGVPEELTPVPNLIACNMSFRRDVALTIKGFRSDIGHVGSIPLAGDEVEFSIRLRQHFPGKKLMFNPHAVVHHQVPQKRARWDYFYSRCYYEGRAKALVARFVGFKDGTEKERTYTLRTLPAGMLRGVGDALTGDFNGLRRAWAIGSGLTTTVVGYVVGSYISRRAQRSEVAAYSGNCSHT